MRRAFNRRERGGFHETAEKSYAGFWIADPAPFTLRSQRESLRSLRLKASLVHDLAIQLRIGLP